MHTCKLCPTDELLGWHIERGPKPIPTRSFDFDFWHDDHDGDNGLCGNAKSVDDAIQQIREIEE